ncbi:MAG: TonB-dependent receptor plug domain-containing protein [Sedimentisphaerales bacterium]|nr:TonB-dependent receptor plug domain-containing protein [Sedimentisphaerales bacterium]
MNKHLKQYCLVLFLGLFLHNPLLAQSDIDPDELTELTIEDLMNIEIESSALLTSTTRRMNPSAMTTITREEIASSGARSLTDLLEIYVPNVQVVRHHWHMRTLGIRGISTGVNYLLLVNGRIMNARTQGGAISERDFPMLNDIHHIDIIRGPGSAIYGPGAMSMVINIITENANTFTGTEVLTRVGAIEEFYSFEVKHGTKFDDDKGLYMYFGIDKYLGSDDEDSPLVHGNTYTDFWHKEISPGVYDAHDLNRDRQAYRGLPRLKTHIEYTDENFDLWARYTKGGEEYYFTQSNLAYGEGGKWGWLNPSWATPEYDSFGESMHQQGVGYQQLTIQAKYRQEIHDDFDLDYIVSYDVFDYERAQYDWDIVDYYADNHREEEIFSRILAKWDYSDNHLFAFGGEWSHEWFGRKSWGYPHAEPELQAWEQWHAESIDPPKWETDTYSLLFEHQWTVQKWWSIFWGGRVDWNTYTEAMTSPRFTSAFKPTDQDTLKLIYTKALRLPQSQWLKKEWDENNEKTDPEELSHYEIRYERQQTNNLWFALSTFFDEVDQLNWNIDLEVLALENIGVLKTWGIEGEMAYKSEKFDLILSHAYTKLREYSLKDEEKVTNVTSEPYGYGNDLAYWHNHISKLRAVYHINKQWNLDGSLQIYWGVPGGYDYAKYLTETGIWDAIDPGQGDIFSESYFLNLGLQYDYDDQLTLRLDGHNILGWLDKDLNKSIYAFNEYNDYRSRAAALSLSLTYKF